MNLSTSTSNHPHRWRLWLLLPMMSIAAVGYAGTPASEPRAQQAEAGEVEHLWLQFEGMEPAKAFVGVRNGQSTTVWFLEGTVPGGAKPSGTYRVLIEKHDLRVSKDAIKGDVVLRQVSVWSPAHLADVVLSIDAKKSDAGYAGAWSSEIGSGKKSGGSVSASVTSEAALQKTNAFADGADWPSYLGPQGTNRSAAGPKLIDDLTDARPVWRGEEKMLSGWGTGVSSRYTWRAGFGTLCGGSSSPIVADGRVYLFHYVPAGEADPKALESVLADFEKVYKRAPSPVERAALVDYCRAEADVIVTCLDARTGALIWRTTFPRWMGNVQAHKWRGLNPSPTVIGSTVIVTDLRQNWMALDTANGSVRWTRKKGQKVNLGTATGGAVRAGSLAILPTAGSDPACAVEPTTGKTVWECPGGMQALVWGKPGAERVVFLGSSNPTCHDASTGKLLWKLDEQLIGKSGSAAVIEGDILVGHIYDADAAKRGGYFQGWKLTDAGASKLWQDEFLGYDENLTVTAGNGVAYLVGRHQLRCLEVATGKRVGQQVYDGMEMGIGSNQWLGLVGDRLLLSPEGQHGKHSLVQLSADGQLKLLGKRWVPPHNSTTAYGVQSIAWPVVDGRIFVRGMDGVYCYDLRK